MELMQRKMRIKKITNIFLEKSLVSYNIGFGLTLHTSDKFVYSHINGQIIN